MKGAAVEAVVVLATLLGGCSLPRAVELSVLANRLPVPAGARHVERSIDPIPAEDTPTASVTFRVDWAEKVRENEASEYVGTAGSGGEKSQ